MVCLLFRFSSFFLYWFLLRPRTGEHSLQYL